MHNSLLINIKKLLLLCVSVAALNACSQSNDDLTQFIATTKSKHLGSVQPLPQFTPYQNFTYSATKLRDPFEQAFEAEVNEDSEESDLRPNSQRPKEPLESFPLDTLRMVGILVQHDITWGLVKDPNNVVHRIQTGNYIGQNEGQIITVNEQQIDLIEIISDGLGGYIERSASLAIGTD